MPGLEKEIKKRAGGAGEKVVAKALGISYVVPEYLRKALLIYGLDLVHHNSDEKVELPIPATYVIDQQMIIRYAFASEDFTKRAKITRIIKALEEIKAEGRDGALSRPEH